MFDNDFEAAFDRYLSGEESELAHGALFAALRGAFIAGWLAAGGKQPDTERIFHLVIGEKSSAATTNPSEPVL